MRVRSLPLQALVVVWACIFIPAGCVWRAFLSLTAFRASFIIAPIFLILATTIWFAGDLAGSAASLILGNVRVPEGREMPLTRGMRSYSSLDIQIVGGKGEGLSCSVPWYVKAMIFPHTGGWSEVDLEMRQACASHDYCYRHGAATYGYTQADCDFQLQEDAFQICQFIKSKGRLKECQTRAQIVALGVIFGGASAFNRSRMKYDTQEEGGEMSDPCVEPEDCSSSYFEYDPYPIRSTGNAVYRIADVPDVMIDPRMRPFLKVKKVVYRFDFHQRTVLVRVMAPGSNATLANFELAGSFNYLASPPYVAHVDGVKGSEDWFIWLQRTSLANTESRLVALAPGRASQADWECVTKFESAWRAKRIPSCAINNASILVRNLGRDFETKDDHPNRRPRPYDPNLNDLVMVPGSKWSKWSKKLHLMSLQPHSCMEKYTIPCIRDTSLDPLSSSQAINEWQEPLLLHDYSIADAKSEPSRYRNYVTSPVALTPASANESVLVWTKREDADYQDTAVLRSAMRTRRPGKSDTSKPYWGAAEPAPLRKRMIGLGEAQEPFVVLGRTTDEPRFMSLFDTNLSGDDSPVEIRTWSLFGKEPQVHYRSSCHIGLKDGWLKRPPIVFAASDGRSNLLASRFIKNDDGDFALQIGVVSIESDGTCSNEKVSAPNWLPTDVKAEEWAMARIPILVEDFDDDGRMDVVLPANPSSGDFGPTFICTIQKGNSCD